MRDNWDTDIGHKSLCVTVQRGWMLGVRRKCIHVLIHLHIVSKVSYQKNDAWHKHMGLHRGTHVHATTKMVGEDMGSQVDIHTFSDACTVSNEGEGPEGW